MVVGVPLIGATASYSFAIGVVDVFQVLEVVGYDNRSLRVKIINIFSDETRVPDDFEYRIPMTLHFGDYTFPIDHVISKNAGEYNINLPRGIFGSFPIFATVDIDVPTMLPSTPPLRLRSQKTNKVVVKIYKRSEIIITETGRPEADGTYSTTFVLLTEDGVALGNREVEVSVNEPILCLQDDCRNLSITTLTDERGFGSFKIKPEPGKTYVITLRYRGEEL